MNLIQSINEASSKNDDCVSKQCHAKASAKSKKDGVIQHVNKDKRSGELYVSDWFDDDETVATYRNGKLVESADYARQRARNAAEAGRGQSARDFENRTMSYAKPKTELGTFVIQIDGKTWKREGQDVRFTNKAHADKAAETISSNDKNKKVEVKKIDEAYYIIEDEQLQALGRELKSSKVEDDSAVESEVKIPVEFKVGDTVIPKIGPHKGAQHKITEVRPNGFVIRPEGLADEEIKYTKGNGSKQSHSIVAKAEQLEKVAQESLFLKIASLSESLEKEVEELMSRLPMGIDDMPRDEAINQIMLKVRERNKKVSDEKLKLVVTKVYDNRKVQEAVAWPFKKFKKGQIVTVKKTGKKVEVLGQNDIGLVQTVSTDKDDLKVKNWRDYSAGTLKHGLISGAGHQEYMPSELQEDINESF